MTQGVAISWALSSFTGWGIVGLNLALNWADDPEMAAVCIQRVHLDHILADRLRLAPLQPFLLRSEQLQAAMARMSSGLFKLNVPILEALDHRIAPTRTPQNVPIEGQPKIGRIVFEQAVDDEARARAQRYPLILTASTWNERLLRDYGLTRVRTVREGIDPALFHQAPANDILPNRFLVFSGGKAELRKGQDIVVRAFQIFAKRHPEAVLVTAWSGPFPRAASTLDYSGNAAPVTFDLAGQFNVAGWISANGIAPDNHLDLGIMPNVLLPPILREMDVAVFPNRAEGATNLAAMECMACGIPVVLSRNSGHLDLIEDDVCYPLDDQRPVRFADMKVAEGWGESQIDEVVARLEQIFTDRAEAKRRGERAALKMSRLTWARTAGELKSVLAGL